MQARGQEALPPHQPHTLPPQSPSQGRATPCRRPHNLPDVTHNEVARLSCWPQEQGQRTRAGSPVGTRSHRGHRDTFLRVCIRLLARE